MRHSGQNPFTETRSGRGSESDRSFGVRVRLARRGGSPLIDNFRRAIDQDNGQAGAQFCPNLIKLADKELDGFRAVPSGLSANRVVFLKFPCWLLLSVGYSVVRFRIQPCRQVDTAAVTRSDFVRPRHFIIRPLDFSVTESPRFVSPQAVSSCCSICNMTCRVAYALARARCPGPHGQAQPSVILKYKNLPL
jgi:hypothetical protein